MHKYLNLLKYILVDLFMLLPGICTMTRYPHIEKDHLVKLLKQLIVRAAPSLHGKVGRHAPNAADVPTLLGTGSFSLLNCM